MIYSIIIASSNEEILNKNILSSPNLHSHQIIVQRGYTNICKAYNDAIKQCNNEYIILVHQDVYLPEDFFTHLTNSIKKLENEEWEILGVAGIDINNKFSGYVNDRGNVIGDSSKLPCEANTLDELLLVIKNKNLVFDENITNHHLFGTDICLQIRDKNKKAFIINAFCHHNSSLVGNVPIEFYDTGNYIKNKWKYKFPIITTTCGTI